MASTKNKNSKDVNQLAKYLVDRTTGEDNTISLPSKQQISALMASLGRKGGKIGGKKRLQTMTAEERRAVAKKAAEARWKRK